jgi:RNA polymerase sigma factor (sigma-70 family)
LASPGTENQGGPNVDSTFEEMVRQHWEAVYRLLYRLSGNRHDAEDLVQETFLRAIDRYDSFQAGTNERAWLMRIASNAFFDLNRRRKTARAVTLEEDLSRAGPLETAPAEIAELGALVAAALDHLTPLQRAVFVLRTTEDLSFREIGRTLDMSEETARWHMMHARRILMARLEGNV